METMEYNLKCIFMMNKTDDPDFVASWQKVEEALKRLDENQVERLFSKKHASLADFHQALTKELELKAAALESAVAFLKEENQAIMQETLKIKSETKKLREERERMSEELLQKKHALDLLKATSCPHERWG
jgi:predicted RNase H-like nuclease (RuvC/YqgF family)